jgi:hypothetical protein
MTCQIGDCYNEATVHLHYGYYDTHNQYDLCLCRDHLHEVCESPIFKSRIDAGTGYFSLRTL